MSSRVFSTERFLKLDFITKIDCYNSVIMFIINIVNKIRGGINMFKEVSKKKNELNPQQKEWVNNLTWIQCMDLWLLSDSADEINYEPLKSYFFSAMLKKEREETEAIDLEVRKLIDNMSYKDIKLIEKISKLTLSIGQKYIINNYIRKAIFKYETAGTLAERVKDKAKKKREIVRK